MPGGADPIDQPWQALPLAFPVAPRQSSCESFRDGTLLRPITPGRSITEAELSGPALTFVDEAYSGMYQYAPLDFLTGQEFRIEIYDARASQERRIA